MQHNGNCEYVNVDKRADILQGTFKHYFDMAMDHHTKATTTSNILIIIVGALIGLVGLDNTVGGGVDLVSGFAVCGIGIFGALWAWKQHERYHYWEYIAYEFSPDHADELLKAALIMEKGHGHGAKLENNEVVFDLKKNPEADACFKIVTEADSGLSEMLKQKWRWRIFYIRAALDAELLNSRCRQTAGSENYFEELIDIYSAQNGRWSVTPPSTEQFRRLFGK